MTLGKVIDTRCMMVYTVSVALFVYPRRFILGAPGDPSGEFVSRRSQEKETP